MLTLRSWFLGLCLNGVLPIMLLKAMVTLWCFCVVAEEMAALNCNIMGPNWQCLIICIDVFLITALHELVLA